MVFVDEELFFFFLEFRNDTYIKVYIISVDDDVDILFFLVSLI